jgi:hypothetical protein
MAFPVDWLQVWVVPPQYGPARTPACLCWFLLDAPFNGAGGNLATLNHQIDLWTQRIVLPLGYSPVFGTQSGYRFYVNTAAGVLQGSNTYGFAPVVSNPAPTVLTVCIQRLVSWTDRRQRGRCYMPVASLDWIQGDILSPAGLAVFQNLAINMLFAFTAGGVNFFPALCSYSNATLTVLNNTYVNPRLSRVMRRNRYEYRSPPVAPKAPPP